MIKPLLKRTILALSIFLTIFCFSVLHTDILALAVNNNVTNGEELFSALSSLKNNETYKNTSVVIDSENAIDYGGFSHVPISLSNTYYKDKNISITFNTNVTNVYNKTLKEYVHDTEHYGLFSNVATGYIPIYYKVNLDTNGGALSSDLTHYKYGIETTLPSVTAPIGKTFIKWVEVADESKTPITTISAYEWGIKNYVAVYEENNLEEDDDILSHVPTTYEIVYSDSVNNTDVSLLNKTYTTGEELPLHSLQKDGFNFVGWNVGKENVITSLQESIPDSYVSTDNKIYLSAVWELEDLSSVTLNDINKIYDGNQDTISPSVNHTIIDNLILSYVWYTASTDEEKLAPSIFSNESKLSFTNHISAYFKVEVKATHLSSGLETNTLESEWVKVNIDKREITPKKISSPTITKIYDGSRAVNYTFSLNTDYVLEGALPNEEIDAKINSSYDSSNVDASSVTLIFESLLFGNNAISDNYSFKSSYYDLYFTASITPYVINLGNENFTKIYGDDDNLPKEISTGINEDKIDVEYTRENGETVDKYAILGVEKLSNNANYLINFIGNSFLYIEKKTPTLVFPAFKDVNYNPNHTLLSLELASEDVVFDNNVYKHSLGNFSWENASLIPSVNFTEGYSMIFTPNDLINYDFSSLDGYDSTTQTIKRKIVLNVLPIDPTPTEIPTSMEVALGRRFSSISLPSGWSIVEEVVSLSSIVNGSIGESQTFVGALVYDYDGTPNYNKIYSDLTIDCVLPKIIYSYGGQLVNSVNQTEVIITPNNEVSIKIKLENPFNKVGYLLSSWNIDGAIVPVSNNVSEGSIYELTEIIKNEISIAVTLKAREDIKVTFRHYYENLELSFNEVYDSLVERNDCVADSTYSISSIDLLAKDGFSFSHSTLNNSNERVENFVVSPLGDSVINLYYTRKNVSVNYVDDNYTSLNPTGSLPSGKVVKFGIPFNIDAPNNYNLQGYTFVGYTDGVTYEGEKLKLFKEGNYSVDTYVESITFSVNFSPVNTLIMDESLGLQNLSAIVGENIILPMEPTNKPEGKRFAGWIINGVTYSAGAEFTMPAESVVLGVLWEDIESNEEDGGKVDLGVIIGASVGSTVGLAVIVAVTVILVKKSKRKGQIELVNNDVINNENSSNE